MLDFIIKTVSKILVSTSGRHQQGSCLRDLGLWSLKVNNNHIEVDGLDTVDLIRQYGSPLFVVNKKQLTIDTEDIQSALSAAPSGSQILYSYKTNSIPGILKEIHALGAGAEVISPYELWLARQLSVPGNMVVYNGVNKTEESLRRAIEMNVLTINIDCREEIDRIYNLAVELNRKARVGLRLSVTQQDQFGLETESAEALDAFMKINSYPDFLECVCVHFNVTSNAKSTSLYKDALDKALDFIQQVQLKTGIVIPCLDIGGGFGVPTTKTMSRIDYGLYRLFGYPPRPPALKEYVEIKSFMYEILDYLEKICRKKNLKIPRIFIEPGRYITSRSTFLLATVLSVKSKHNGTRFVITDAGRLSCTYPCDYEYHEFFLANRVNDTMTEPYQVMGRICTQSDWTVKNRYFSDLRPGDIIAIMDAGAYFFSYSTNFAFQRPSVVMVEDGMSRIIRREETFEHLAAMDILDDGS